MKENIPFPNGNYALISNTLYCQDCLWECRRAIFWIFFLAFRPRLPHLGFGLAVKSQRYFLGLSLKSEAFGWGVPCECTRTKWWQLGKICLGGMARLRQFFFCPLRLV